MYKQRRRDVFALAFLFLLLAGCSGPSELQRRAFNASIASGDYVAATDKITSLKDKSYGSKNAVLYYLDLGAVQHDGGLYRQSDDSFAIAEDRMDALYTKSVSREAGRFLLNDSTVEYAGEHFERVLVNVYRVLDYIGLNDRENALVEIRKLSRLLQEYADTNANTAYRDDAFAEYLSALLYADGNQPDDARISFQAAQIAYNNYAKVYDTPMPALPMPALDSNAAELVFIHGNGIAPYKVSRSLQVAWNDAIAAVGASRNDEADAGQALNAVRAGMLGKSITISYPAYVQAPYRIAASAIEADGASAPTWLAEDITQIAMRDLDERQASIMARTIARATIKYILAQQATMQARKQYGDDSVTALLTQITTSVAAAATEVADTRAWATLPAQFRIARIALPPGEHEITVHYYGAGGREILTRIFKVTLVKGQRTYLYDRTAQ